MNEIERARKELKELYYNQIRELRIVNQKIDFYLKLLKNKTSP